MNRTNTSKTRNAMETKCLLSTEMVKVVFKGTCFNCGMRTQSRSMLAETKREKGTRESGRKEKVDPKELDGPKENDQTCSTLTLKKRAVLKWIRGLLLNLFHFFVRSV